MNTLAAGLLEWTSGEWIAFITALVALIKSFRSDAKSDAANDRVSNVSKSQDNMRSDLTKVAAQMPSTVVQVQPQNPPQ